MTKAESLDVPHKFHKMNGLGNDFLIIDGRARNFHVDSYLVMSLASRHFGVGFDQLAVIHKSILTDVNASLEFWNADGTSSPTCGNATRCIAKLLMDENKTSEITLSSNHTILKCIKLQNGSISVNMGKAMYSWQDIPLSKACDTLHLPIKGDPVATSIGNPHCTFFVPSLEDNNIEEFGKIFEKHELFPARTNVQIAEVLDYETITMKVWERGVGVTLASGSSACAVVFAAWRRKLVSDETKVLLDGGELNIKISNDGIWMSGVTSHVFDGILTSEFLLQLESNRV
jgi:diaminopimelate epimerase